MFRALLLLVGLLLIGVPALAFTEITDTPQRLLPFDPYELASIDLEGDGAQELYSIEEISPRLWRVNIVKVDGSIAWSTDIDEHDLDLGFENQLVGMKILGIDDYDSSPGREILFFFDGDYAHDGFFLVSVSTEAIIWQWPGPNPATGSLYAYRTVDMTGDNRNDLVIVDSYVGNTLFKTQIWSYGPLAAITEPGQSSEESRARGIPNPSNGSSQIAFDLADSGPVSVDVIDLNGKLVRHLADGVYDRGRVSIDWDGRDDRERDLPGGVYFARIETAGKARSSKIVLTR